MGGLKVGASAGRLERPAAGTGDEQEFGEVKQGGSGEVWRVEAEEVVGVLEDVETSLQQKGGGLIPGSRVGVSSGRRSWVGEEEQKEGLEGR